MLNLPFKRILLILLPPILALLLNLNNWTGVYGTFSPIWYPFEWMCFFSFFAFAGLAYSVWKPLRNSNFQDQMLALSPFMAFLPALLIFSVYPTYSWDYDCYATAAQNIISGINPYENSSYVYPPFLSIVLSRLHILTGTKELSFMIYQYFQLLMLAALIWQIRVLLPLLGLKPIPSAILLIACILLNIPLWRTLHYSQVNLILLNIILFVMLNGKRSPLLSGFILAIGIHVKLYPLLLLPVWIIKGRFLHILSSLLFVVLGILGMFYFYPGILQQFYEFILHFPAGVRLRDNSIHSILYNLFHITGLRNGLSEARFIAYIQSLYLISLISVLIFFAYRTLARVYPEYTVSVNETPEIKQIQYFQLFADICACMLLVSPMVWEHHYVLALPLILICLAGESGKSFRPVPWIGAGLILLIPVNDIFILSLNRIAGLMLLLWYTHPPNPTWLPPFISLKTKAIRAGIFTLFAVVLLSFYSRFDASIYGDGCEYIVQTEGWQTQGFPRLDAQVLGNIFIKNPELKQNPQFAGMAFFIATAPVSPTSGYAGFLYTKQGTIVGYHAPLYTACVMPIKYLLEKTGDSGLKAFTLFNLGMLLMLWAYILFAFRGNKTLKLFLCLFLFFSPVLLYLRWPHPEVFTITLCAGALLAFYDKRLKLSLILIALASVQNPPLIILILLPLHAYLPELKSIRLSRFMIFIPVLLIFISPYLYFYLLFGHPNMIAYLNGAGTEYINAARIFDFFLDVNQGMVVGWLWAMGAFLYVLIFKMSRLKPVHVIIYIIILSGITLMVSMTSNWNMGQAGMSRYSAWAGVILLIPALIYWPMHTTGKIIACIGLLLHVYILEGLGMSHVESYSYLQHNITARWLLDKNPSLYNPEMEIFAERSLGKELNIQETLSEEGPVFYIRSDGKTTKAIVNKQVAESFEYPCSDSVKLRKRLESLSYNASGFAYVDLIDLQIYPDLR